MATIFAILAVIAFCVDAFKDAPVVKFQSLGFAFVVVAVFLA